MNFSAERTLAPVRSSLRRQLADLVRLQAGVGAERFFEDQLGRFLGDFFDVHAAGAASHEHGQAGGAVDDDAEVQLAGDVAAGFDEDAADGLAFGARLDGDELVIEQSAGNCGGFFGGANELHAVLLRVVFDRAFAAAAGVDLGFHDGERAAELLECGGGFVGVVATTMSAARRRRLRGAVVWLGIRESSSG